MNRNNIFESTEENIVAAAERLKSGGLVVYPTETVYGLGGNAYDDGVVAKIFSCKQRLEINPVNVCYASLDDASKDVVINEKARVLAENFFPGAMTLLLERRAETRISLLCSAGMDIVGVRVPSEPVALRLLSMLDFPLATPSANRSKKISPTNAEVVAENFREQDITILDGGRSSIGIESTIIDCTKEKIEIVRLGAVPIDEIIEKCNLNPSDISYPDKRSVKYYSTNKKLVVNANDAGEDDALLAFGRPIKNNCRYVLNLSESMDLSEAAANLFAMMHALDRSDAKKICVMKIPNVGVGIAINDRLLKAAGFSCEI